jgi:hypothetical protein
MSANLNNNIPPEKGKNNNNNGGGNGSRKQSQLPVPPAATNPFYSQHENPLDSLDKMLNNANTHKYSSNLRYAAEDFLIKAFDKGVITNYSSDNSGENSFQHTPLLFNIAMYILTNATWIQSQPKEIVMNLHTSMEDEFYNENDEDEDDNEDIPPSASGKD